MAKQKSNMVTRRVVESRTYDIYSNVDGQLTKIDTRTISGRVNTSELAEEYKVDKVVTVEVSVNKKVYGVPIDEFMKIAVEVEQEQEEPKEEQ